MQEKLKQLEVLVSQMLARQKEVVAENATLKNRLRTLEEQINRLKSMDGEIRSLREWKKNTQNVLKRVAGKLDKEIAKARERNGKIM